MNRKTSRQRIGGFVLAALLLFGVAIISSSAVQAQRGGHGGGGFHGGGFHGGGFHGGGFHRGGFHGGGFRGGVFIGPRFGYGYGYPYGYYGYPYGYGYYSHYVFGDSEGADAQGYQDGLKTGADDARRHQSFDPQRSHYYKDSGFGNFAQNYRDGFDRGYSQGFGR
jgi:hypothetical protein